jgi:hypothetical protein
MKKLSFVTLLAITLLLVVILITFIKDPLYVANLSWKSVISRYNGDIETYELAIQNRGFFSIKINNVVPIDDDKTKTIQIKGIIYDRDKDNVTFAPYFGYPQDKEKSNLRKIPGFNIPPRMSILKSDGNSTSKYLYAIAITHELTQGGKEYYYPDSFRIEYSYFFLKRTKVYTTKNP